MTINNPGVSVHLLGDYAQTDGLFSLFSNASLQVDGAFTKSGNGTFEIHSPNFSIGDPAASSIEAGASQIDSGSVTLGDFIARDNFLVNNPGVSVHLVGDYEQTGGYFQVISNAHLEVDGDFTKTGEGDFLVDFDASLTVDGSFKSSNIGRIHCA